MAWLTISVNSIADHTVSAPCKPTVQRAPGRDKRPTWASSWDYPRHRRAHEGAPSLLREHATSLLRRPIAARPHTRACDAHRRTPSSASRQPALGRVELTICPHACGRRACSVRSHGSGGGRPRCSRLPRRRRSSRGVRPVCHSRSSPGAHATQPSRSRRTHLRCRCSRAVRMLPPVSPDQMRSLRARACRARRHACGRTHSPSGAPTAFALACVGCVRTLHVPFSSR